MIECPKHSCKCKKCIAGERLVCSWRAKASAYLRNTGLQKARNDGCVTYIQALELADQKVPQSARERNLLNNFARQPEAQPLRGTQMIFDLSQGIDHCRARFDGTVGNMATNAKMWSVAAGRDLNVSEMAKLMGHDLGEANLRTLPPFYMRQMLSTSMHVATAGYARAGLLAALGATSDERLTC